MRDGLIAGLIELCRRHEASSVHFTFLPQPECQALAGPWFLHRTDQQFHWEKTATRFDAFLEALNGREAQDHKRERRDALAPGITVHWFTGRI